MILALAIFVFTLTLVIWQPKGLGIGWSAGLGTALAMLAGVVSWQDIPAVWHIVWNATVTFIAIIIISLLLDEAGFFEWIALHVVRWAGGSGRKLFTFVILLGAVVSAFFNNDGAALILTPIVIAVLIALRFSPATTLAFVMAAGFVADTGSLPLIISNLVNIISADFFAISFSEYAAVMVPVNLVSVLATWSMLYWFFRKDLPAVYELERVPQASSVIRDRGTFIAGWYVLALLLAGFFLVEPTGIPVSAVAAVGALVLLAIAAKNRIISPRKIIAHTPWQIIIFSLGMYLVVYGLRNMGVTDYVTRLLDWSAEGGIWGAALLTGFMAAFLSSIMNNLPAVLTGALAIDASQATGLVRDAMVYANVIGCDLGPKITPIGSLATLIWLHVLARKNILVGWGYYFRVGIVLTLPVLFVTLVALALRLSIAA
jgi:arsenical pump membrane protein